MMFFARTEQRESGAWSDGHDRALSQRLLAAVTKPDLHVGRREQVVRSSQGRGGAWTSRAPMALRRAFGLAQASAIEGQDGAASAAAASSQATCKLYVAARMRSRATRRPDATGSRRLGHRRRTSHGLSLLLSTKAWDLHK